MLHWLGVHLLLPLLGVFLEPGATLTGGDVELRAAVSRFVLTGLCVLCGVLVWRDLRRAPAHVARRWRLALALLRLLFLLGLLLLLSNPVLRLSIEGTVRSQLIVLIDDSASMRQSDARLSDDDLKRAAIASGQLAPTAFSKPTDIDRVRGLSQLSRSEVVSRILFNRSLNLLKRLNANFNVRAYTFGQTLAPLPAGQTLEKWLAGYDPTQQATAMGDAITAALAQNRGQPVAGIWLITDGQSNSGAALDTAVQSANAAGVPVYAYGVGITAPRDIAVSDLFAPDVVFVNSDVAVTARLHNTGFANDPVNLRLSVGAQVVESTTLVLDPSGEQSVVLRYKPEHVGDTALTVSVQPLNGEATTQNNSVSQHVRIIDSKIHVFYVERSARWEFKYLLALLGRDPRVSLKCWLLDGDPGISLGSTTPFVSGFAKDRQALLDNDLLILGDIDPNTLTVAQWKDVDSFVGQFGGGLLTIAGRRFMPSAYARHPLAGMLPVELPLSSAPIDIPANTQPIHLRLTPGGKESPLLRLAANAGDNEAIWENLPPIFWAAHVGNAKEAADVLAVDPDPARKTRESEMSVLAMQSYGSGQVLYVGTDNLWRWRKNVGDALYARLWGQLIERLTLPRLLGQNKRTRLSLDKLDFCSGEVVTVYARLYDAAYHPLAIPSIAGAARRGNDEAIAMALRPVSDDSGVYRGTFRAGAPGDWSLSLASDPTTMLDFTVTAPALERNDIAMNEAGLRNLSAGTGGRFFREENLAELPDVINAKAQPIASSVESEICFTWTFLTGMLTLLIAEWSLRKWQQLK